MMSSVNKNKMFLEPAKHISERVRKLLHQAAGARKSNIEYRTRRWKIKSIGIIVSRNYPITDYYKFLHSKSIQSDNNYFCTVKIAFARQKQPIKSQLQILHLFHPCNYRLIALFATNQIQVILHRM